MNNNKKLLTLVIAVGVLLLLAITIVIPFVVTESKKNAGSPVTTNSPTTPTFNPDLLSDNEKSRVDCYPEAESPFEKLTQYQCEKRNCIYDPNVSHPRVPKCYFNNENLGYKLIRSNNGIYDLQQSGKTPFAGEIKNIQLLVEYYGENIVRVKIYDPSKERYEVPINLYRPDKLTDITKSVARFDGTVNAKTGLFEFKIVRKENSEVVFDTSVGGFIFCDQFLQIGTKLNTNYIFGFGENNHESFKHDFNFKSWGMFTRDFAPGWGDNRNNYGHQPFYLGLENSGKSHGVLFFNSNAMEYIFNPSPSLFLRSIGGIFDFYFIIEQSPLAMLERHYQLIGLPVFPPYWSLGFQLSRWGYHNLDHIRTVVDRTREAKIPQDVQYADIDYMIGYRDFTVDPINFNGLYTYFEGLQKIGMKLVLIQDPGLVIEKNYTSFTTGLRDDVYIRWPKNLAPYDADLYSDYVISWCWPNAKIVYPDFFLNRTHIWWQETIDTFRKNRTGGAPIDGLWIDMNEPSSFETNELKPWNWLYPNDSERYPLFTLKCPTNRYDDPPYRTRNTFLDDSDDLLAKKARLSVKTICMVSIQGDESKPYYHYDVHSLYGYTQSIATFNALKNLDSKRPFVLSRSTYTGSGNYTTHWLGDNEAWWKHLRMSIIGMFEFNMFGMPMVGADICGFFGNTTLELCQRWQEVGAFYPFSRNHNANQLIDQDPASFGDESLIRSTRNTLIIRYTILPYLYTLFYHSHVKGGAVARPLAFEFPTDKNTWDIEEQFLLGSAFLVSPALHEGQNKVNAYIPDGKWYEYREGVLEKNGFNVFDTPIEHINLHVRGGYILPTQDPKGALNTAESRKKPFGLLIVLDKDFKSAGDLFWDNGDSFVQEKKYYYTKFLFDKDKLSMTIQDNYYDMSAAIIDEIKIYGTSKTYTQFILNGQSINPSVQQGTNTIKLSNLSIKMNNDFSIEFK